MAPLDAHAASAGGDPGDLAVDQRSREIALTAIDRSLLLEAGAGSGKTSVLAGRVVKLMAEGRAPRSIAAISFTELSAAELRERICSFAERLLAGDDIIDLRPGFPDGLTPAQRENLERASRDLDELVCTTIHGFCGLLLKPYPVEAGIDPGAAMLDEAAAELLREEVHDRWLRERLSAERDPNDAFVALHLAEPTKSDALLRRLVGSLLNHRGAQVEQCPTPFAGIEFAALHSAITSLTAFVATAPEWAPPAFRAAAAALLELQQSLPAPTAGEASLLAAALALRVPQVCANADGAFNKRGDKTGTTATAWKDAAKEAGQPQTTGERIGRQAKAAILAVGDAFQVVLPAAAGRILHIYGEQAQAILREYAEAKRAAAALDFGDLLEKTRQLLAGHDAVRRALADRYQAVLVDEFQDTDGEQTEIFWRLCGNPDQAGAPWKEWIIRPGALFLVGDPQQSIYLFRGADLGVFKWAREALRRQDSDAILKITRNFRSRGEILRTVNGWFEAPLGDPEQCGFTALTPAVEGTLTTPGVAALDFTPGSNDASVVRDAEAAAVARLCQGVIGHLDIRTKSGETRKCQPGDIALLVPTGTDLWRYERALEDAGLSVSAQAGKGFFRRQEIQDLIALTRTIADERDRLALGALLRGPLVGLTDEQLLDAVESLPRNEDGREPMLSLRMELPVTANPLLRSRLAILRSLADRKARTTPHLLLCQAVEEMGVRAILRARGGRVAERALANVDVFLELSQAYAVRGLKAFSDAMREQWEDAQRSQDGRPDADERSIDLITMHSAKGLEWPVVIPVNTWSRPDTTIDVAYDNERNLLYVPVFGSKSTDCDAAFTKRATEVRYERQRLWYVAVTRARDLLLMPRPDGAAATGCWSSLIAFALADLPAYGADLSPRNVELASDEPNDQDPQTWSDQAERIAAATRKIERRTPHLAEEGDEMPAVTLMEDDPAVASTIEVRGSLRRGLVIHKLIEEVLTGETPESEPVLAERGQVLALQLAAALGPEPDAQEMAACVLRALSLPEVATVRQRLVPEWNVSASQIRADRTEEVVFGVADALVPETNGPPSLVVDWKSDVQPSAGTIARYTGQVRDYLNATGARAGLIVFVTSGTTVRVEGAEA